MDCCICGPMAAVFRPPRNTICSRCYEGARNMISLLNELETKGQVADNSATTFPQGPKYNSPIGISNAFMKMKQMKEDEEAMNEKVSFLEGLAAAQRDGIHTDIMVKPGSGPTIPAHRALLAIRSEIFRTMLSTDECKAPVEDTISLPELSHDELESLIEFLYTGSLSQTSIDKHSYTLLIAADKYDIPYLRKYCEQHISTILNSQNALDVLEVSELCSNGELKQKAMDTVVKHFQDVVFSKNYDEFAARNSHLCVEITRALVMKLKDEKNEDLAPSFGLHTVD